MTDVDLILNTAYVLLIAGAFTRNVLWLRSLLVCAAVGFVAYGLLEDIPSMIVWNIITGTLHASRIMRALQARKSVDLTEAEAELRDSLLPDMSDFDFNILWSMGANVSYSATTLIEAGTVPATVSIITSGEVCVVREEEVLNRLGVGYLVGEMSFVSGQPARASVIVDGLATVRQWNQRQLASLDQVHPSSARAFQALLASDLVRKVDS